MALLGPVSVVIPVYNRSATLARAISSVLAQDSVSTEIIVVDDHSSEPVDLPDTGTNNVRVLRLPQNVGAGPARNSGAAEASHGVLAFLDADDEFLANSLERRLRDLRPQRCVVGDYIEVDDRTGSTKLFDIPDAASSWLRYENLLNPTTFLIHADDFWRAGGFPDDRDCAEDWIFCLRALRAGIEFVSAGGPLYVMHLDGTNTTRDHLTLIKHALGAVRLMDQEQLLSPEELLRVRRIVEARVAGYSANAGWLKPALRHAFRAARGGFDPLVARELAHVPVQGARGMARRRLRGPSSRVHSAFG